MISCWPHFKTIFLIDFRQTGQRRGKCKRDTDLLFHLFTYSLGESSMCPDWGSKPQSWPSGQCSNQLSHPPRVLLVTETVVCGGSSGPTSKGPNHPEVGGEWLHRRTYFPLLPLDTHPEWKAALLGPQSSWQRIHRLRLPETSAGILGLAVKDRVRWQERC